MSHLRLKVYGGRDPASGIEEEAERYERLSYNIHMPEDAEFFIDFPPDKADLGTYCASLGHKVSFSSEFQITLVLILMI